MLRIPDIAILAFLSYFATFLGQFSVIGKVTDNTSNPILGIKIYEGEENLLPETNVGRLFEISLSQIEQRIFIAFSG